MKTRRDFRLVPDGDHLRIVDRNGNELASISLPDGQYTARDAAGERIECASSLGGALAVLLQDWEEGERRALRTRLEEVRRAFGLASPTYQ